MGKTAHDRNFKTETIEPAGGLAEADLDRLEQHPGFQRMADEADRAEREGRITSHEDVLRRNPPVANHRRKNGR